MIKPLLALLLVLLVPSKLSAGFSIDDVSLLELGIDRFFTFTVTLDQCASAFCGVTAATQDDTATEPSDYRLTVLPIGTGPSSIPQQWDFSVLVYGDQTVELTEQFFALLINPVGADIDDAGGVGTILNDDVATVSLLSPVPEETEGTPLTFSVRLSAPVDVAVTVDYATEDQSALVADDDYLPAAGTLQFDPHPLARILSFDTTTLSDTKVELDETLQASLSDLQAAGRDVALSVSSRVGAILNNDSATVTITDVMANEGDGGSSTFSFTAGLDVEVDVGVDVDFATADGTATVADDDYVPNFGTLLFAGTAGETETLEVTVNGDVEAEPDESFFVDLSNIFASGRDVSFADDQGEGTILDDDPIFVDGFESGDTASWSSTTP